MFQPLSRQPHAFTPLPVAKPAHGPVDCVYYEPRDTVEIGDGLAGAALGGFALGPVGLRAGVTYGIKSSLMAVSSPIAKTLSFLALGLAKGAVGGLLGGILGVAVGMGLGAWLSGKMADWRQ